MQTPCKHIMKPLIEYKFQKLDAANVNESRTLIEGYASLFNELDQGGDIVAFGAYRQSLERAQARNQSIKMLWQHNPSEPIGLWDTAIEDNKGLYVQGRLLHQIDKAQQAAILIQNGVIDGLSIGYRIQKSHKTPDGVRVLTELDLWEISLVTFPMLPLATCQGKTATQTADMDDLITGLNSARALLP